MGNELATQKETRSAKTQPEFSTEQVRLLAETVAKGCDQNELAFFLQVAKLKRLDPFTGQIHVVKRWDSQAGKDKITIQTGVDGYRAIASRTGELAGIDDPDYDVEDGEHPNWAKVTVYRYGRNDEKIPYKATARWSEYAQTKKDGNVNSMWRKLPFLMLGKCAESLALRKAFPDELSGMYTNEEMDQADNEPRGVTPESIMGKPQVQMPRSTDDKKPPVQQGKAETVTQEQRPQQGTTQGQQSGSQSVEKLSGEIAKVTPGKNGVVVLAVNGNVVVVPAKHASDDLMVGAKILCSVIKVMIKGQPCLEVTEVEMVVPPVQEDDIVDAEFVDSEPKGEDPVLQEARDNGLSGLFEEKAPEPKPQTTMEAPAKETGEATKPGTAGLKRAQRLHTLISQNSRNTGFTEAHLKKYLSMQNLEHARDLLCPAKGTDPTALNAYEYACSMAVGEVDWREVLDD